MHFRFSHALALGSVLVDRGAIDRARSIVDATRDLYPPDLFPWQAFRWQALDAVVRAAGGDVECLAALQAGLRRLQALGVEIPLTGQPVAARQVAELLVRHRIEIPYVRAWIRRANLRPSTPDLPDWPWPVRIRTLGEFRVEVDDVPLEFEGKAPRKPLELLQAIAAFGGREIPSETLCNALWPDSDGDMAEAALRMTLSRLRKLLKHDAVDQRRGKISLDPGQCWLDVWAARSACKDIEAGRPHGVTERLLDVYRGAFLEKERDEPWMLPARNQLRRQFAAAIAAGVKTLEREGRMETAAALLRQASQRDPVTMVQSAPWRA